MDGYWDDILEKLNRMEADLARIGQLVTCVSSEIEQTTNALDRLRADLNKTKKQAATLKALSPYRRYARTG
jgi:archaellum component FlaC